MFWNKRFVRIAVGVMLLAAAVLALLPGLTGYTSLDGTINARFAEISAPIEGTVLQTPPKTGTHLREDAALLTIRNERVNRAVETSLVAELETTRNRVRALENQRSELEALRARLGRRFDAYSKAMINSIEQQIAISRQRITMLAARRSASAAELRRNSTLMARGVVSQSSVDEAEATEIGASAEVEVENLTLKRLERQLEAMRQGVFLEDGQNDVPYSHQRQDELAIQIADLDARAAESRTRLGQISNQLAEEARRVDSLERAVMTMPFNGVIWRNNVVAGANVVAGNELLRVLDCRDLFVDILVPEVDFDQIYPRRAAEVRILGTDNVIDGEVISVRGNSAVVEEPTLAAMPPSGRGRNARIRVALANSSLNTDYSNFCHVGRSVQVRFHTRSFTMAQWLTRLWFSIW
ncbi:HlyD family efflux transporter periplasmic adaptor subunit [Mesorhizobium tamadayense]|uniref:HlyD family efflux transporter periplasmic adaptor subunit n=1 Tax=Mesorhizobium tamadayense TaxID=425306 RepID=A0A3P3FDD6_9HYPH|nr:HlyD family efflux transporter periplasmic adaptor subunit [Mesorhizobium tamadayense]RRH96693.1 HlyD family efflux transporter periplasmic adaptor subunit [Mesorhizobium tamadayense]